MDFPQPGYVFSQTQQGFPKGELGAGVFFGSAFGQENAANDRDGMNRVVCMTLKFLNRNRINQAMNEIFFAVIQEQQETSHTTSFTTLRIL
jgi:hypothetical protein